MTPEAFVRSRLDLAACLLALAALVVAVGGPATAGVISGGGGAFTIVSQDTMAGNFTTTSTVLVDVTDLTHTYTARAESVLVDVHIVLQHNTAENRGILTSNFNAVQVQELSASVQGAAENDSTHSAIGQTTAAGSITHKAQAATGAGTLTLMSGADAGRLSVWGVR